MSRIQHSCGLSRRQVGLLVAGAGGLIFMPHRAHAREVEALALTCMDYRLIDDAVRFFDGIHLTNDYDEVSLAGAALAAVSPKFPSSNAAFWDHVVIARQLHHVKKVVLLDHRDCGAYKVAYGKAFAAEHNAETAQHKDVMLQTKATLAKKHPELGCEGYLMALDGTTERLI